MVGYKFPLNTVAAGVSPMRAVPRPPAGAVRGAEAGLLMSYSVQPQEGPVGLHALARGPMCDHLSRPDAPKGLGTVPGAPPTVP